MNKVYQIAIVVSRFNEPVTSKLHEGAVERLIELGVPENQQRVVWVPGAVEIPLIVQKLVRTGRYDAVIALGAVIRGETTHYDYVCQQISDGCQRIALENDIPVIFGVLTTENAEQAFARVGGAKGHKGYDAAEAAVEMIALQRQINVETQSEEACSIS